MCICYRCYKWRAGKFRIFEKCRRWDLSRVIKCKWNIKIFLKRKYFTMWTVKQMYAKKQSLTQNVMNFHYKVKCFYNILLFMSVTDMGWVFLWVTFEDREITIKKNHVVLIITRNLVFFLEINGCCPKQRFIHPFFPYID